MQFVPDRLKPEGQEYTGVAAAVAALMQLLPDKVLPAGQV